MIPILYEKDETEFTSNGLGRLHDCISCTVTEERNSIYEADFEYPVSGAHYEDIRVGRIIGVTHDDTGDIQPFDIVSYTRPIDGVVTFHCTHISYRLNYYTVVSSRAINSLSDAIETIQERAKPTMPFRIGRISTWSPTGLCAAFDGLPHTARSLLGGMEGSVLDAYGGEYMWDKWRVLIQPQRGIVRDFVIRYGVNMLDYNEEFSTEGTYSACVPYWTSGDDKVVGDRQVGTLVTITGRGETMPLDVSDKFENKPTKAQVNAEGLKQLNAKKNAIPSQNIKIEFVRLQDMGYPEMAQLMTCRLCDTIKVIFPDYQSTGNFKIVKTVWNVLRDRYDEMELGELSTTLAEALGISGGGGGATVSGGGGAQLVTINQSYSNVSVPSSLYVKIDTLSNITDTSVYSLISVVTKGWSGVAPLEVVLGSNGSDVYVMGRSAGTINSMSVNYTFIKN